jgi:hypothetical protein
MEEETGKVQVVVQEKREREIEAKRQTDRQAGYGQTGKYGQTTPQAFTLVCISHHSYTSMSLYVYLLLSLCHSPSLSLFLFLSLSLPLSLSSSFSLHTYIFYSISLSLPLSLSLFTISTLHNS